MELPCRWGNPAGLASGHVRQPCTPPGGSWAWSGGGLRQLIAHYRARHIRTPAPRCVGPASIHRGDGWATHRFTPPSRTRLLSAARTPLLTPGLSWCRVLTMSRGCTVQHSTAPASAPARGEVSLRGECAEFARRVCARQLHGLNGTHQTTPPSTSGTLCTGRVALTGGALSLL